MEPTITPGISYFDAKKASKVFPINAIDPSDVAIKADEPDEAVFTSLVSPIDQNVDVRYANSTINNVYNGTGIEPGHQLPSKKGFSLVTQVRDTVRVTDPDLKMTCDMPVTVHLVVKAPRSAYISKELLEKEVSYAVGTMFRKADAAVSGVDYTRMDALIRGSLVDILND